MSAPATAPPLQLQLSLAADALQAVRAGRSLGDALARCPSAQRAGVQALAFLGLRWLGSATVLRQQLAPKAPPPAVDALLCLALALLWPAAGAPYAEHTLVDQAVAAARRRTPAAAGFVNAVLRRFLRERERQVAQALRSPLGAHNHPLWWTEQLQADWPQQAAALLEAANQHPPMTLRVNARRGSAAAYQARLAAQGRPAWLLPGLPQALLLAAPCPVDQLPGFAEGDVSVQDAAAQRAAPLLLAAGLPAGARVLDACAAPGGKTAHLLELASLELLAIDHSAVRLAKVAQTLQRLQLPSASDAQAKVELKAADACDTAAWWDGRPFDAILLDAPCSASGIVRRHPDVRWLRRHEDIAALAALQQRMLRALWPLLKPGGRLLYATCSVFKQEGRAQIDLFFDAFLQRPGVQGARLNPTAPGHLLPLADNPAAGLPPPISPLSSPGAPGAWQDGFFYALLEKT